ncbi:hypothetical protein ACTXT7_010099, partial [Hymenolepis weldensis]
YGCYACRASAMTKKDNSSTEYRNIFLDEVKTLLFLLNGNLWNPEKSIFCKVNSHRGVKEEFLLKSD